NVAYMCTHAPVHVPWVSSMFLQSITQGLVLRATAFLAYACFIAHGLMSIPAGFLVERFTEKPVMIAAFLAGMIGSLSFALSRGTPSQSPPTSSSAPEWRFSR